VGDDYYLVNSSFEYFPGIPLWHSRDLRNWRQLGNVLDRFSQLDLEGCPCSDGIYAPTIRFHQGRFYVVTTLVQTGAFRNFYVTAESPAGPWSDPVWLDQSGIDPSLFFASDGRVFLQTNRPLRFDAPRAIYQSEIDVATGQQLSGPTAIWGGTGGSYVEGPHLYERGGWLYLLAAEGGTAYGHMVTIARSRDVWGPYESCPHNPILSNRHAYEEIHGTGHGDLIEAADGSWWMVHLGFRQTVGDVHTLGRETCLAPVEWVDDWPVVNRTGTIGTVVEATLPGAQPKQQACAREDFDASVLGPLWIKLRRPVESNYSLTERPGFLRLHPSASTLDDIASPTFLARRQQHFHVLMAARLDYQPSADTDRAGLSLLMTNRHRYDFLVTRRGEARVAAVEIRLDRIRYRAAEWRLPDTGPVELRILSRKETYDFECVAHGQPVAPPCQLDSRYLATEVTGGFNGVVVGMFANSDAGHGPVADFDWFDYHPQEDDAHIRA
jgi:alpha-N-arabinofuranosidase